MAAKPEFIFFHFVLDDYNFCLEVETIRYCFSLVFTIVSSNGLLLLVLLSVSNCTGIQFIDNENSFKIRTLY